MKKYYASFDKNKTYEQHLADYNNLIYKQWLSYNMAFEYEKDMIQEGKIGLLEAIKTYKEDKGSFPSWVQLYVRKRMNYFITHGVKTVTLPVYQLYPNHRQYNPDYPTELRMISLDRNTNFDNDKMDYDNLENIIPIENHYEQAEFDIDSLDKQRIRKIKKKLKMLREIERQVIQSYLDGLSLEQMKEKLQLQQREITSIKTQAIRKLRIYLNVETK
jgi:RNA polymerase sigma factor (sigma-70 family)